MADPTTQCRSCRTGIIGPRRFCPACGELYPGMAAIPATEVSLRDLAPEVVPLVQEKVRLGAELEGLAEQSDHRELTPDERRRWEQAYTRWRDVASEITLLVDRVHRRADTDRRSQATPPPAGERRSREDRRDPFWGRAP